MKKQSLSYYENEHNENFPGSKIKALYLLDGYLYCQTGLGLCKKSIYDIGKYSFGIGSAIDKTDFIIRKFIAIHGNKYDYSLVNYIGAEDKVRIVCPLHGEFSQTPNSHMHRNGCMECGREKSNDAKRFSLDFFINRANEKHGYKYDYSLVEYVESVKKVIIICPLHGEFKQVANSHLQGCGCPKCGFEHMGEINSMNPTGWSRSEWIKTSAKSKKFDCFKVYIIKCWNDEEEFYKIGRTFLKVKQRFNSKLAMPYNYEIVKVFEGNSGYIFNLECRLKNNNKSNKYLPTLKFSGMKECFNKIEKYDE